MPVEFDIRSQGASVDSVIMTRCILMVVMELYPRGLDPFIGLRIADVPPDSLVDYHTADGPGGLPDHLHKDRNDRLDLSGCQAPEEALLHRIDPREEAEPDAGIPQ